jgi:hypothetical protein
MRTTFSIVTFVAALPAMALAQTTPVSTTTNSTPPAADASLHKTLPTPADATVLELSSPQAASTRRVTLDGPLVRAARAGQLWQAVNPFAPAEFGQGYESVSADPHSRQPTGIVLVSVRFGGAGRHR